MSANKTPKETPYFSCAATHDRPCTRRVPVEGAVCAFCMYDGHVGAAYPKAGPGRADAEKFLTQCFENAGKMFAKWHAKRLLAKQGNQEEEGKA